MPYDPLTPEQYQQAISSGFTHEQIVAHELTRKAQEDTTPGIAKPVLPPELSGNESVFKRALRNLPSSALNAIRNPVAVGMPGSNPNISGDYKGPTPESVGNELKSFARPFLNPKESFAENPVQTSLTAAGLGKGALEHGEMVGSVVKGAAKGGFQEGTRMIPFSRWGHTINVPAPIAGMAAGELLGYPLGRLIPQAPVIGAAVGAATPVVKGIIAGGKEGLAGYNRSLFKLLNEDKVTPLETASKVEDTPVGPVERPNLSSGRKIGGIEKQTIPVKHPMDVKESKDIVPPGGLMPESVKAKPSGEGMPIPALETRAVQAPSVAGRVTPSGEVMPSRPVETPAKGIPETPIESSFMRPVLPPSGLKVNGGETPSATEVMKSNSNPPGESLLAPEETEPSQWTWDAIKEKFGQDRVDSIKAKYKDISNRLKSSNMDLETFMKLPQETKDAIVQTQRHPTNPKRPKYSSGFNPKYENLFREIHNE